MLFSFRAFDSVDVETGTRSLRGLFLHILLVFLMVGGTNIAAVVNRTLRTLFRHGGWSFRWGRVLAPTVLIIVQ
jgi:hypothetical protein